MKNIFQFIKAEYIKTRSLSVKYFVFIFPILSLILVHYELRQLFKLGAIADLGENFAETVISSGTKVHSMFLYIIFLILTVSQITYIDHKNGGWQLMETQPFSKASIFFGKYTTILLYTLASIIFTIVGCYTLLLIEAQIHDFSAGTSFSIPWILTAKIAFKLLVSSLLAITTQYVLSVLMKSFIWPVLIGVFGYLGTTIATSLGKIVHWNPYFILSNGLGFDNNEKFFYYTDMISIILSVMLLVIGFIYYIYKSPKAAFIDHIKNLIISIIIILGSVTATHYLIKNRPHDESNAIPKKEKVEIKASNNTQSNEE